jgi:hypothetical protein
MSIQRRKTLWMAAKTAISFYGSPDNPEGTKLAGNDATFRASGKIATYGCAKNQT